MKRPGERDSGLPESLTRHLTGRKRAIWPTPEDRNRYNTGAHRPRLPSKVFRGVWLWAAIFNLAGGAILALLWSSMG